LRQALARSNLDLGIATPPRELETTETLRDGDPRSQGGPAVERLRKMARRAFAGMALLAMAPAALAVPNGPAEKSLAACQARAGSAGAKYLRLTQGAIAACLEEISGEVLRKNASVAGAEKACTKQFDKIGRTDGRSFGDTWMRDLAAKCDPLPANPHTLDDLLGSGSPGVAEPLEVADLSRFCSAFGGDGSVGSFAEWASCAKAAQDCSVATAIGSEFPRAAEWLEQLWSLMPPSEAKSAIVAFEAAVDGADDDGVVGPECGSAPAPGGGGFPATGQITCWGRFSGPIPCAGTGQDGDIRAGAPLAFQDNGDGTITDLNTSLTWEKKSDDGSLNDKDNRYAWSGECGGVPEVCFRPCQTDRQCGEGTCGVIGHGDCSIEFRPLTTVFEWVDELNAIRFAGHDDWRVPNRRELESLLNLENANPAVSAELNANCGPSSSGNPGCTVLTCSCTVPDYYWSSSVYVFSASKDPWIVSFIDGTNSVPGDPTGGLSTRAVRGGTRAPPEE
jgi:hypothetical protein